MALPDDLKTQDSAATAAGRSAAPLRDTFLTVLLVLYPALCAVGVIAAGLIFSNTGV